MVTTVLFTGLLLPITESYSLKNLTLTRNYTVSYHTIIFPEPLYQTLQFKQQKMNCFEKLLKLTSFQKPQDFAIRFKSFLKFVNPCRLFIAVLCIP